MQDWKKSNNTLEKKFIFKNFSQSLGFVNAVGAIAEKQEHHPDILIFDYRNVKITTTTHDAGNKITEKDERLIKAIDQIKIDPPNF